MAAKKKRMATAYVEVGDLGEPARPGASHGAAYLTARTAAGLAVSLAGVVLVGGSALVVTARALVALLGAAAG